MLHAFGGAETVEASVALRGQIVKSGNLRCEWPVVVGTGVVGKNGDGTIRGDIGIYGLERDAPWCTGVEDVKGFRASVKVGSLR
jgi:hypothetical protein